MGKKRVRGSYVEVLRGSKGYGQPEKRPSFPQVKQWGSICGDCGWGAFLKREKQKKRGVGGREGWGRRVSEVGVFYLRFEAGPVF